MDIIVLEGPNSCGKTSSLGMLYAYIANAPGTKVSVPPDAIYKKAPRDFVVLLEYPGAKQGPKKIAIATAGDTQIAIKEGVKFACTHNTDILVIAKNIGETLTAPSGSSVIYTFPKTKIPPVNNKSVDDANWLAVNMKTAQDIMAVL